MEDFVSILVDSHWICSSLLAVSGGTTRWRAPSLSGVHVRRPPPSSPCALRRTGPIPSIRGLAVHPRGVVLGPRAPPPLSSPASGTVKVPGRAGRPGPWSPGYVIPCA